MSTVAEPLATRERAKVCECGDCGIIFPKPNRVTWYRRGADGPLRPICQSCFFHALANIGLYHVPEGVAPRLPILLTRKRAAPETYRWNRGTA